LFIRALVSSLRPVILLLALVPACHSPEAAPPPPAPTPPPASVAPPAPVASASAGPATPEGVCHRLLAANRDLLAQEREAPAGDQSFAESCFPTAHGAWALRLDQWKSTRTPAQGDDAIERKGHFTIVHLPDGAEAKQLPAGLGPLTAGPTSVDTMSFTQKPVLFDYDGDGEPEIFLPTFDSTHEGADDWRVALLTWKKGAITAYPGLPADLKELKDVDGDGRPDLLYYPVHAERSRACSGFDFRWDGPAHVAHSLPGGAFSLDDKVATDQLLRACPAPPKGKSKPVRGAACDACPSKDCRLCAEQTSPPELCARLHGASEKDALALLKGLCKAPAKNEEACQTPAGVCGDFPEREKAVRAARPLAAPH
jgi:hypothetical protein